MKPDLEYDLLNTQNIVNKCKHSDVYAQNLYSALCNNRFFYDDKEWSCSWRVAGSIVSDIRNNNEDYMVWYCSGIGANSTDGYVPESFVTDEIRLDLIKMGWVIKPYENL